MKKITIVIIAIMLNLGINAQGIDADTLLVFSKYTPEGVMLKIAPQRAQTWLLGAENGYEIRRTEIGNEDIQLLTETPLKPYNKDEFKKMANGDSVYSFQKNAVFDNITKNKSEMSVSQRIMFVDRLQNDYGFYFLLASRIREISISSGLEFIDKTAKKDRTYIYSIKIKDDKNSSHAGNSIITTTEQGVALPELVAIEGDSSVQFRWMQGDNNPIFCYYIEKSVDNKIFEKVNKSPIYNSTEKISDSTGVKKQAIITYNDKLDANYKPYYYRIIGIDLWSSEIISKDIVKVMGRDLTAPPVPNMIKVSTDKKNKSITYKWEYNSPSDFAGYKFYVSDKYKGEYKSLNDSLSSPTTNSYTIDSAGEGEAYYLRIIAFDTVGNYSVSNPKPGMLADIYPPTTPKGFKASIDTNGILKLVWNKNPESDIRGYKVFGGNTKLSRKIAPTGYIITDTFFVDTIWVNTLSKHKYFTMVAVDRNYNISKSTSVIKVNLPDRISPSAGIINNVSIEEEHIRINWTPSASDDIAKQVILRHNHKQNEWETISDVSNTDTTFLDIIPEQGRYEYSIMAIDSSGNKGELSYAYPLVIKAKASDITITDFKVKKKNGQSILTWNSKGEKPKFYLIYRKSRNNDLSIIASIKDTKFTDKSTKKDNTYTYYIIPQDENGVLYSPSKTKKVGF